MTSAFELPLIVNLTKVGFPSETRNETGEDDFPVVAAEVAFVVAVTVNAPAFIPLFIEDTVIDPVTSVVPANV